MFSLLPPPRLPANTQGSLRTRENTPLSGSLHTHICPTLVQLRGRGTHTWSISVAQLETTSSQVQLDSLSSFSSRDEADAPSCDDNCKADFYNRDMAVKMEWTMPFEYHPDRGLYFHEVAPGVYCGTQPRSVLDVEQLKARLGISTILCLQTESDINYWGVKLHDITHACDRLRVSHVRKSARDFDPHSLRKTLPSAVKALQLALLNGSGPVYVHCTAGLGRAPAVCIAHQFWFGEASIDLDLAYQRLTTIRPCGPKRDAIRGATFDLMDQRDWNAFDHLPQGAWASLNADDKRQIQGRVMNS